MKTYRYDLCIHCFGVLRPYSTDRIDLRWCNKCDRTFNNTWLLGYWQGYGNKEREDRIKKQKRVTILKYPKES